MAHLVEPTTLRVRLPLGKTAALALVWLLFGVGVLELLARSPFVQSHLLPPSVGSPNRTFEVKLVRLEQYAARYGHVDCIFVGSSVVYRGINPEVFAQAYAARTGTNLRCFNFGLPGISASTAAVLAQVLAQEYNPTLIVYGTTARDYDATLGAEGVRDIEQLAWVQYRTGRFNLEGWLIEHSLAYRDFLTHRSWMHSSYPQSLKAEAALSKIAADGFDPRRRALVDVASPADPAAEQLFFRALANYEMSSRELAALDLLAALRDPRRQVVVAEVPVHPTSLAFFPNGATDYRAFVETTRRKLQAVAIPFVEFSAPSLVPNSGWYDRGHLKNQGAKIFSEWLGGQLGAVSLKTRAQGE